MEAEGSFSRRRGSHQPQPPCALARRPEAFHIPPPSAPGSTVPNIGFIHPQVVHFVVALGFVGVGARVASLLPLQRLKFSNAMATWLIVLAAIAAVVAHQSGHDAHGPVERVPGAREAVTEHEEAGELARNVLIGLAVLELATLALSGNERFGKGLRVVSAVGGLAALFTIYRAADMGGHLVYNYAGGVGIRSGDTSDVRRLLVAGLYNEAMQARTAGRKDDAARLITELKRQMPADTSVQFLAAESQVKDLNNGRAALAMLDSTSVGDSPRWVPRKMMLTADAYAAAGVPDSARLALEAVKQRFPQNQRLQDQVSQALQRLAASPAPAARDTAHAAPGRGASRVRP